MAQREKEQELVFRGQQYARAIGLFQRKYANTPPPTLDVLVQEHFLRKKYKDPITNADFVPIPAGQAGAAAPGGAPGQCACRPRRADRGPADIRRPRRHRRARRNHRRHEREHGAVDSHLQRRDALQPVAVRLRARCRHARCRRPGDGRARPARQPRGQPAGPPDQPGGVGRGPAGARRTGRPLGDRTAGVPFPPNRGR